jgi:hypothetical protein
LVLPHSKVLSMNNIALLQSCKAIGFQSPVIEARLRCCLSQQSIWPFSL